MNDPLLTIGAFAKAAGLTATALRHYDEVGLLLPADVDAATGYRYYTPELVRRARLIARMRDAGLPIDIMRTVLDGTPAAAADVLSTFLDERARRTSLAGQAVADVLRAATAGATNSLPTTVVMDGPEVAAAIRQVRVAADSDRRGPLGSVLFDLAAVGSAGLPGLDVVATNRHWLVQRVLASTSPGGAARVVLHPDVAGALADLLDSKCDVELRLDANSVTVDGSRFAGRDVPFPDHRAVVAGIEPAAARAIVDRSSLLDSIRAAAHSEVDLHLDDATLQVGSGATRVPVVARVTGEAITVRLGSALLQRALGAAVGDTAVVEVSDPHRPVVVRSPHQRGFVALVMPIRAQ